MSNITFEQACDDRCLDKIVPSDLRQLVAERDNLHEMVEQRDTGIERLRDRVAQLEAAVLNAVQLMPCGQAKADLRDAYDEDEPAESWLLHKQAEALEAHAKSIRQWAAQTMYSDTFFAEGALASADQSDKYAQQLRNGVDDE